MSRDHCWQGSMSPHYHQHSGGTTLHRADCPELCRRPSIPGHCPLNASGCPWSPVPKAPREAAPPCRESAADVAERSRTSAVNQTYLLTTKPLKHLTASRAYLLGVSASQSDLSERSFQPHLGHAKLERGSGEENILHLTTCAAAPLRLLLHPAIQLLG